MTAGDIGTDRNAIPTEEQVVQLVEETARIAKREGSTGKVRITTLVETVEETVGAELSGEAVEVTRVPMDQVVAEAPRMRTEGDLTIIPIVEEVLFVEKRLVLKEELHIRRMVTTERVDLPVTLRKERASIERMSGETPSTEEKIK